MHLVGTGSSWSFQGSYKGDFPRADNGLGQQALWDSGLPTGPAESPRPARAAPHSQGNAEPPHPGRNPAPRSENGIYSALLVWAALQKFTPDCCRESFSWSFCLNPRNFQRCQLLQHPQPCSTGRGGVAIPGSVQKMSWCGTSR